MKNKESDENPNVDKYADLRRLAEHALAQEESILDELSSDEARQIVHELQVHQVELEMQNEELRATQMQLEASRDRFSDLYDLAPIGYITVSEKGMILAANLTLVKLLGVERSKLIHEPLSRFIVNEDQDRYYLHRRQIFNSQEPQTVELRMLTGDNIQISANLEWKYLIDNDTGDPICWVMVTDITKRVEAEEALKEIQAELRARVEDRADQLQLLVNSMTGREVRMAGLKTAINKLRKQLKDNDIVPSAADPLLGPDDE